MDKYRGKVFTAYDGSIVSLVTEVNQKRKLIHLGNGQWWTLADFLLVFNTEEE